MLHHICTNKNFHRTKISQHYQSIINYKHYIIEHLIHHASCTVGCCVCSFIHETNIQQSDYQENTKLPSFVILLLVKILSHMNKRVYTVL